MTEGVLLLHACIIWSCDNLSDELSMTPANFFRAFLTVLPTSISANTYWMYMRLRKYLVKTRNDYDKFRWIRHEPDVCQKCGNCGKHEKWTMQNDGWYISPNKTTVRKAENQGCFLFLWFQDFKNVCHETKKKKRYAYLTLTYPTLVNDMSFMLLVDVISNENDTKTTLNFPRKPSFFGLFCSSTRVF